MSEVGKDYCPGNRFHFIGNKGKSADISLMLVDTDRDNAEIIVRNHMTGGGNKITFEAPEGYPLDESWFKKLLSVVFLSAANFVQKHPREQALALGIDTTTHDLKIKDLKAEFTLINRDKKQLGPLPELGEKVEKVSVSKLVAEKERLTGFNREQTERTKEKEEIQEKIEESEKWITQVEKDLQNRRDLLQELQNSKKAIPEAKSFLDVGDISQKIEKADETNLKADQYKRDKEAIAKHEEVDESLRENKRTQKKAMGERTQYIQSFNLPFKNLSIDNEGGLMINERPLSTFSKGEQEIAVAQLHASINPELKLRFLDNFESLDEENQERILKKLFKRGFQVITAEVDGNLNKPNTIVLKECKEISTPDQGKKEE
jgi:hypothetical protein